MVTLLLCETDYSAYPAFSRKGVLNDQCSGVLAAVDVFASVHTYYTADSAQVRSVDRDISMVIRILNGTLGLGCPAGDTSDKAVFVTGSVCTGNIYICWLQGLRCGLRKSLCRRVSQ